VLVDVSFPVGAENPVRPARAAMLLHIWLGTGGSLGSVLRAAELLLPTFIGILGGSSEHWAQCERASRQAWAETGHSARAADIAALAQGHVLSVIIYQSDLEPG